MNTWAALLLVCLVWLPARAKADKEWSPRSHVAASPNGQYIFKMIAPKSHEVDGKEVKDRVALGIAYEVLEDGSFRELWRMKGFYSFELFLANSGEDLIGMGPWPRDQEGHTDMAITFFDRGKLVKQYLVKDLIKDPTKIENSVHHYMWRPEVQTRPNGFYRRGSWESDIFHLVTIDRIAYGFDIPTGAIVTESVDEGAKGLRQLRKEEAAAEAKEAAARAGKVPK